MKSSLPPPTKAESERIDKFRWLGCVVCLIFRKVPEVPWECHHLVEGNQRVGHWASVPLCSWHHRGVIPDGYNALYAAIEFGPSKARNPAKFEERYGSDRELLKATDALIAMHEVARRAA